MNVSTPENNGPAAASPKESYLRDLSRIPVAEYPDWVDAIRRKGESLFREIPLPDTHQEEWRQTNLSPIVDKVYTTRTAAGAKNLSAARIAPYLYGDGAWHEYVFIDGFWAPDLSVTPGLPEGVLAGGLKEAFTGPRAAAIEKALDACLTRPSAYTALNTAFLQDGAFLHVPKGVVLEAPVHFLFLTTRSEAASAVHPRLLFLLESSAEASILISHVGIGNAEDAFDNVVEEAVLGDNARLTRYEMIGESGYAGRRLCTTAVRQQRDSRFHSFSLTLDGAVIRNQIQVTLAEEGGETALNGLYLNDGEGLVNNDLYINHAAPRCSSRIGYKGVLAGKSRSVYTGMVYVAPESQQTDSMQLNNNLLLSEEARVDTKPQLEIYADDVKCTHGSTVGSPPDEVIFYFRSRGMDEETAQGMLTYGFADELAARIPEDIIRKRLDRMLFRRFRPQPCE